MIVKGGVGGYESDEKFDIAWFGDPRYVPIAGGTPVRLNDGSIVGAVGAAGRMAKGPMGDEALAQIGAKAVEI